ncbi:L-serine ammonia-lyase, iron-sulfur-dependent subunit beta [Dethiothermospora halolimnae]|uniref:L-serine ammonia-lyase, iron-sulfur-dependent subunit beta n=1 Tax=Dethiothermospora halolimnae TaxID=3114390 RepID=UPI003CCBB9FD
MNGSVFEIIGPDMIGPSSSHTAGAARLGKFVHKLISGNIDNIDFLLHGSFAKTYQGHGTDRALMAGILGFNESDERLRDSLNIASNNKIKYKFIETNLGDVHPNTVKFIVRFKEGGSLEVTGSSIGGGNIKIIEINGLKLEFTGQYPAILTKHIDNPGVVNNITKLLAKYDINIAFMSVYRQDKGQEASMVIETDDKLDLLLLDDIKNINGIKNAYIINSI